MKGKTTQSRFVGPLGNLVYRLLGYSVIIVAMSACTYQDYPVFTDISGCQPSKASNKVKKPKSQIPYYKVMKMAEKD